MDWTLILIGAGIALVGGLIGLACYFFRQAMRASE